MEEDTFLAPLLLVIGGLVAGVVLKSALRRTKIPYTVGLFGIGLLTGLLNRWGLWDALPGLSEGIHSVADINPDLILYLFLPVLIFDAAYELNLHIFRKTLANAALLAVPGLVVSMILTGTFMVGVGQVFPEFGAWSWTFALMFGALISATDPVAVVALLRELKTSKRFSTLVDAESLLNDGTGIVCFMLFFGPLSSAGQAASSPFVDFMQVVSVSVLLGFVLARLVVWFITRINSEEMIQNSMVIVAAYLTFILSQYYLGVSGVIALLVFGLTVTYVGKPRLKPQVNEFMERFWELLTYVANTLIFILVGIVIAEKVDFTWSAFGVLILLYMGLNLFRFVMIMLLYPFMKRLGYGLSKRESVILTWGGLRGALGMVLALMVSYAPAIPEDVRSQMLFFTAGIVTLTLCVNATTTRWLLNRLKLTQVPSARAMLEYNIRKTVYDNSEKYLEHLEKREALAGTNWDKVRNYLAPVPYEPLRVPGSRALLSEVRLRVLDREKTVCHDIYGEGIISQGTFRRLMNSLDELYDHDGAYTLDNRRSIFDFCASAERMSRLHKRPRLHDLTSFYFRERIAQVYDLGRGFIILEKESLKFLEELDASSLLPEQQRAVIGELKSEIGRNIDAMNGIIGNLAVDYPKAYRHALTKKSVRMLLSNERRTVRHLEESGMISEKDANALLDDVDERSDRLNAFRHTIPGTILRKLFGK